MAGRAVKQDSEYAPEVKGVKTAKLHRFSILGYSEYAPEVKGVKTGWKTLDWPDPGFRVCPGSEGG
ncbi:Uncharacterized protein dnl_41220 [Desulfonema limicola]|uniref:Uncharacterized protein n=1 Tax=Desulfonema limicola TaxID=45656 RepID=A0A975BAE9_9BACT|nr:Uncharacterized protein dnl_41220 [Desulfonema limicola]